MAGFCAAGFLATVGCFDAGLPEVVGTDCFAASCVGCLTGGSKTDSKSTAALKPTCTAPGKNCSRVKVW